MSDVITTPEVETEISAQNDDFNNPNNYISQVTDELMRCFDIINRDKFDNELPRPIITLQEKKNTRGHCSVRKIWVPVRNEIKKSFENDPDVRIIEAEDLESAEAQCEEDENIVTTDDLNEALESNLESFLESGDYPCFYEINIVPDYIDNSEDGLVQLVSVLLHEAVHLKNIVSGISDTSGAGGRNHNKRFLKTAQAAGLTAEKLPGVGYAMTEPTEECVEYIKNVVKPDPEKLKFFRYIPAKPKKETPEKKKFIAWVCPGCGMEAKGEEGMNLMCSDCQLALEPKPRGKRGRKAKSDNGEDN